MTKEVLVNIEGRQPDLVEESVKSSASGIYHLCNGKHYIQFDEISDGGKNVVHNTLKITNTQMDVTKKGALNSQMVFKEQEGTISSYQTPYGVMPLQIFTSLLVVEETEKEIRVKLKYDLSMEGNHISENVIEIIIRAKE